MEYEFDPRAFEGTAGYYSRGRPPYSAQLAETLAAELALDGTGRLLDVGCGPGVLALSLAQLFEATVALDPEPGMLAEGERLARARGVEGITWVHGRVEDLAALDLAPCRLVTFGQSFHRVHQLEAADLVYDLLEPGGAIALVAPQALDRPHPIGPELPGVPDAAVKALVIEFLGDRARQHLARWATPQPQFAETLAHTRFEDIRTVFAPGPADFVRDIDSVVANYFSMSWSAPRLFGDRRAAFEDGLRALLLKHAPEGLFWDWPGDTEVVLGHKRQRRTSN